MGMDHDIKLHGYFGTYTHTDEVISEFGHARTYFMGGPRPKAREPRAMQIALFGQLPSYRSANFNRRTAIVSHREICKTARLWFERLVSIPDLRQDLTHLIHRTLAERYKVKVTVDIRRKRILDYKNAVVGFDHVVLDGLVRGRVLPDDRPSVIDLAITQAKPDKTFYDGKELVWMMFEPSDEETSKTYHRKGIEFMAMIVKAGGDHGR